MRFNEENDKMAFIYEALSKSFSAESEIEKAIENIQRSDVFFSRILAGLEYISVPSKTMSTDGKVIKYNPEFVEELVKYGGNNSVQGILVHEILHIALGHHLEFANELNRATKTNDEKLSWLVNVAADLAINSLLYQRPGFPKNVFIPGVNPQEEPFKSFPKDKDARWYFNQLVSFYKQNNKPESGEQGESGESGEQSEDDNSENEQSSGQNDKTDKTESKNSPEGKDPRGESSQSDTQKSKSGGGGESEGEDDDNDGGEQSGSTSGSTDSTEEDGSEGDGGGGEDSDSNGEEAGGSKSGSGDKQSEGASSRQGSGGQSSGRSGGDGMGEAGGDGEVGGGGSGGDGDGGEYDTGDMKIPDRLMDKYLSTGEISAPTDIAPEDLSKKQHEHEQDMKDFERDSRKIEKIKSMRGQSNYGGAYSGIGYNKFIKEQNRIPWNQIINEFLTQNDKSRVTYKRRNRRIRPGSFVSGSFSDFWNSSNKEIIIPSRYDKKLNELIFIVDVSGSNQQAASEIFPELKAAINSSGFGNQSSLRLVSFNTAIEDEYIFTFNPSKDYKSLKVPNTPFPKEKIIIPKGNDLVSDADLHRFQWRLGGGTVISPVFDALQTLKDEPPFIIILTDGEFGYSDKEMLNKGNFKFKIIWVMTRDNGIQYQGYRTYKLYEMDYLGN